MMMVLMMITISVLLELMSNDLMRLCAKGNEQESTVEEGRGRWTTMENID